MMSLVEFSWDGSNMKGVKGASNTKTPPAALTKLHALSPVVGVPIPHCSRCSPFAGPDWA